MRGDFTSERSNSCRNLSPRFALFRYCAFRLFLSGPVRMGPGRAAARRFSDTGSAEALAAFRRGSNSCSTLDGSSSSATAATRHVTWIRHGTGRLCQDRRLQICQSRVRRLQMARLNLPHDWAVELPSFATRSRSHGFKPLGRRYPETSVGWYRREFEIPAGDLGRRITVEFDGAFRGVIDVCERLFHRTQ